MGKFILNAQIRNTFGKKNQVLRKQGLIPCIVYGRKTAPLALQVNAKNFWEIYQKAGETDLIDLVIERDNKKEIKQVLIQDIARDHILNQPIHVDFYEVEMDKPVTAHIPLVFINEAPATKLGGVLVKSMDEIEIEALPKDLPHALEVDVSSLTNFDQTLYVRDLKVPKGVKILVKEDTPVVTVNAPLTEEELEAELGEVKSVEEVEVEKEKKIAEEGINEAPTKEQSQEKTRENS